MAHCIGRIFGGTALALVLASGAYAQDAASGAVGAEADISAEPATTNPAKAAGPRLDEIVVTAQKRVQGLQDVPLSLSVVSADDIRQAGIQNFNEMARFMPNVSVNEGSNSMYIRGIGTPELNPIGEQAVAYIIDGVYVSKLAFVQAGPKKAYTLFCYGPSLIVKTATDGVKTNDVRSKLGERHSPERSRNKR